MNARTLFAALLLVAAGAAARPAAAQVFTPSFLSPQQGGGAGVFLSGGIGREDGYALEGVARRSFGPFDLGLRVGLADLGGAALLVGLEYRNPLPLEIPDSLVEVSVTGGAQGIIGGRGGPGISAGATAGRRFPLPSVAITPYVHPRLAFLDRSGGGSLDLALLGELGADFAFASDLRFHLALGIGGETANLGFGVSWR